jgi:hypothetical protein
MGQSRSPELGLSPMMVMMSESADLSMFHLKATSCSAGSFTLESRRALVEGPPARRGPPGGRAGIADGPAEAEDADADAGPRGARRRSATVVTKRLVIWAGCGLKGSEVPHLGAPPAPVWWGPGPDGAWARAATDAWSPRWWPAYRKKGLRVPCA